MTKLSIVGVMICMSGLALAAGAGKEAFTRAEDATIGKKWGTADRAFEDAIRAEPKNKSYKEAYEKMKGLAYKDLQAEIGGKADTLILARRMRGRSELALRLFPGDGFFDARLGEFQKIENGFDAKFNKLVAEAKKKMAKKDYKGAAKLLDKAAEMDPDSFEVQTLRKDLDEMKAAKR